MSEVVADAPAVQMRGVVKRYGDLTAVDGLDLSVPRGVCQGLLGPNGAGKTTAINMMVGLAQPDEGSVCVLGMDWARQARAIRQVIGVQLQETVMVEKLSVRELLTLFRSLYHNGADIDDLIALVGLQEKADERYGKLSGGQRQRLALGCALVNNPQLLVLDEPTTGLDPQARRRVWEAVEAFKLRGGSVLLTTHYMDEAQLLCDDIVIVDHGRQIAQGSPDAIIDSLGAQTLIEFSLADSPQDTALAEADLLGLPGVRGLRAIEGVSTLHVDAVHTSLPALLELVERRGLELDFLQTHRPTLEDVFVSLTGRSLRDG